MFITTLNPDRHLETPLTPRRKRRKPTTLVCTMRIDGDTCNFPLPPEQVGRFTRCDTCRASVRNGNVSRKKRPMPTTEICTKIMRGGGICAAPLPPDEIGVYCRCYRCRLVAAEGKRRSNRNIANGCGKRRHRPQRHAPKVH